jgi:hypothetical protein
VANTPKIEKASQLDLKLIYTETLRGYTRYVSEALDREIFIKHLGIYDTVNTDEVYERALEKAKENKLPTDEEQKVYLEKQDLWSEKKDLELAQLQIYVSNLQETKSKLFLKSQIDPIKKDIEENKSKMVALEHRKRELLGLTAEAYAAKKTNENYIKAAIFEDKTFTRPALDEEKFNDLSDNDLTEITLEYNIATRFLNVDSLKKISILPFFCNYFYLADDNPQMATEAKAKPPQAIMDDPEKLLEFYESRKNAEEFMEKTNSRSKNPEGSGGSSIVGATKADLEAIGMAPAVGSVDLIDVAAEKGGQLNMQDFIDLHS